MRGSTLPFLSLWGRNISLLHLGVSPTHIKNDSSSIRFLLASWHSGKDFSESWKEHWLELPGLKEEIALSHTTFPISCQNYLKPSKLGGEYEWRYGESLLFWGHKTFPVYGVGNWIVYILIPVFHLAINVGMAAGLVKSTGLLERRVRFLSLVRPSWMLTLTG